MLFQFKLKELKTGGRREARPGHQSLNNPPWYNELLWENKGDLGSNFQKEVNFCCCIFI